MRKQNLISVVIPTHDRPAMLAEAVGSVLAQSTSPAAVFVVNDGHRDLPRVVTSEPKLRVIRNQRAPGGPGARNTGLGLVETPWVVFLDDDDLWDENFLACMIKEIGELPEDTVAVGAGFRIRSLDGTLVDRSPDWREVGTEELIVANQLGPSSFVACRTETVRQVGGFDEDLPGAQDWDLWIRLSSMGRVFSLREVLGTYRIHEQGQISCPSPSERYRKYRPFFEKRERHPRAARHHRELAAEVYWWGVLMAWTGDVSGAMEALHHARDLRRMYPKAWLMTLIVRSPWRRSLLRWIYGSRASQFFLHDRREPIHIA